MKCFKQERQTETVLGIFVNPPKSFWKRETFFQKGFINKKTKKEPNRALFLSSVTATAPTRAGMVKGRITSVEVFTVKPLLRNLQRFTESLIVDNFSFAEVANGVDDVRVINKAENIIVGDTRLLLGCELIRRTRCEKPLKALGFSLAQGF